MRAWVKPCVQVAELGPPALLSTLVTLLPSPCTVGFTVLYWTIRQVLWPLPARLWVHSRREGSSSSCSFWR